jgi:hypothetical protein
MIMTLSQWETRLQAVEDLPIATPRVINTHAAGGKWIPDGMPNPYRRELWSLSDYLVSSVTGGTIWLTPRQK